MFTRLILLILVLFILAIAPLLVDQKGYLLIAAAGYTIEMTLVSLACSLIICLIFAGVLWAILRRVRLGSGALFSGLAFWRNNQRVEKDSRDGLLALAKGNYAFAADRLSQVAQYSNDPELYHLLSAHASAQLGLNDKVAENLAQVSDSQSTMGVSKLSLLKQIGEHEKAQELEEKLAQGRYSGDLAAMDVPALIEQRAWDQVESQLKRVAKNKRITAQNKSDWERAMHLGRLQDAADKSSLQACWKAMARKLRIQQSYQEVYVERALTFGMAKEVESLALEGVKSEAEIWYKLVATSPVALGNKLLSLLQKQAKQGENAWLLFALGNMAYRAGDLILAKKALQKSAGMIEEKACWRLLAEVLEKADEQHSALAAYKKAC